MNRWRSVTPVVVYHTMSKQVITIRSMFENVNITKNLDKPYSSNLSCNAVRLKSNMVKNIGRTAVVTHDDPIIVAATARHSASIIFLHGLGDTGHGWASLMEPIRGPHIKVICPHAPIMSVTISEGLPMHSWFDLLSIDPKGPEDAEGMSCATAYVHDIIKNEISHGIPSNRILVGGFSQGGAVALNAGLTYHKPLGGIMSLSSWMLRRNYFPQEVKVPLETPIFLAHGDVDPAVPFELGLMTAKFLKEFMKNVQFFTYKGLTHSTSELEHKDMKNFIEKVVPNNND